MASGETEASSPELVAFHRGDRAAMEACYLQHFADVDRAVGRVLRGADRENVVHEVFFRLLTKEELRRSFQGGRLGAWLAKVATHQAIDYLRHHRRESPYSEADVERLLSRADPDAFAERAEAREWVAKFQATRLPPKWQPVFQACFLEHLDQRTAAHRLGMARTTLAYQHLRIRRLLRRFMLEDEGP